MEILMNLWFSFNAVFGLWSGINWVKFLFTCLDDNYVFSQNQLGQVADLIVPVSILTYILSV